MRVIIPGASGLIGRNILLGAPQSWEIVAVYRNDENFPSFVEELNSGRIETQKCNLLNPNDLRLLTKKNGSKYDLCIFLAANSDPSLSDDKPVFDLESNVKTLINFAEQVRVERFLFFSSGAVYEGLEGVVSPAKCVSPTLPYAISKVASESYVKHFKKKGRITEYMIARFFGAYGPHEHPRKIYTKLVKQFFSQRNPEFTMRGNGKNIIDAMYVDDAINGIIKIASSPFDNSTIDFCCGNPMTIQDLITKAAEIFGINEPCIIQQGETAEFNSFWGDPTPFTQHYRFKPKVELAEGLHRLAEFLGDKR